MRSMMSNGERRKDGSVARQTRTLQSNPMLLPPPPPSFLAAGYRSYGVFPSLTAQLGSAVSIDPQPKPFVNLRQPSVVFVCYSSPLMYL